MSKQQTPWTRETILSLIAILIGIPFVVIEVAAQLYPETFREVLENFQFQILVFFEKIVPLIKIQVFWWILGKVCLGQ